MGKLRLPNSLQLLVNAKIQARAFRSHPIKVSDLKDEYSVNNTE